MVTRTCDSPDFYTLSYGCTKTLPNKHTAENEMTCACWANYCNDFTFASLKDAFHRNGKVLWTSGQSPPVLAYTPKPGAEEPDDNGTYVTRPYVASDVGPRPGKTCAASTAVGPHTSSLSVLRIASSLLFFKICLRWEI